MEALISINTSTVNTDTSSTIQTSGILPRYYDSAPNIIVSDTNSLVVPGNVQGEINEPDEDSDDD